MWYTTISLVYLDLYGTKPNVSSELSKKDHSTTADCGNLFRRKGRKKAARMRCLFPLCRKDQLSPKQKRFISNEEKRTEAFFRCRFNFFPSAFIFLLAAFLAAVKHADNICCSQCCSMLVFKNNYEGKAVAIQRPWVRLLPGYVLYSISAFTSSQAGFPLEF